MWILYIKSYYQHRTRKVFIPRVEPSRETQKKLDLCEVSSFSVFVQSVKHIYQMI